MNIKKFHTSEISAQELEISHIFHEQYNNLFNKIIYLSQQQFNNLLQKSVYLTLKMNKKNFPSPLIKKVESIFCQIYLKERKEILSNIQKLKNMNHEQLNYLDKSNYYIHCQKVNEAIHTCGNSLIYYEKIIYCLFCDEVFKENQIHMLCTECNCDFYSKIKINTPLTNLNLYPASYSNNDNDDLNDNVMECLKCKKELYLDISLNKDFEKYAFCIKCNITYDTIKTFKCSAKLFTGFNKEEIDNLYKINTLISDKKAIPNSIINLKCNCDISKYNIFKDDCGGVLFEGSKKGKKILVCDKCYKIYNYEKFEWICPSCNSKFKTKELRICRSSYKKKCQIKHLNDNQKNENFNLTNINNDLNTKITNFSPTEGNIEKSNSSLRKMASHDLFHKKNKNNIIAHSISSNKKLHSKLFEFMNFSNEKNSFRIFNKPLINPFSSNKKILNIDVISKLRYDSYPNNNNPILNDQKSCSIKLNMMEKFSQCDNEKNDNNYFNVNSSSTKSGSIENTKKEENVILLSPTLPNNKKNNNNLNIPFNADNYNIKNLIGEGSFAKIYLVEDPISHHKYALKKISACSNEELNQKKKEYELISELNKSISKLQIIKILGIQTKKLDKLTFVMYVLMELATCDWEKEIKKRSKSKLYYKEKELFKILSNLVFTFSELQKRGICHRDVKPQNILLFPNGDYKISDFGEAKKKSEKNFNDNGEYENDTNNQTVRGTELYMSPILFKALRSFKMKSTDYNAYKNDVFSLGLCILFACNLNYQILYDIREINDMIKLKEIVFKYLKGKFSLKFINLIIFMINIKEKKRPDFVELDNWIRNNY